jgi:hypothetical protein
MNERAVQKKKPANIMLTGFCFVFDYISSGRQDSNLRPPGPKPGAITGLRYAPNFDHRVAKVRVRSQFKKQVIEFRNRLIFSSIGLIFHPRNLLLGLVCFSDNFFIEFRPPGFHISVPTRQFKFVRSTISHYIFI